MALTGTELDMVKLLIERANETQRMFIKSMIDVDVSKIRVVDHGTGFTDAPLRVGDKVIFFGRKTKPPVIGTIKSMNDKTYTITDCSDGGPGWRMPPSMLRRYGPGVQPVR